MPATCKKDLLSVTEAEYAKLVTALDRVPVDVRLAPDPAADGITLKDILGHRAH